MATPWLRKYSSFFDQTVIGDVASTPVAEFTVVEKGTKRGKPMLVESDGYTYTVKKISNARTFWWCSVRGKDMRCGATVTQHGELFRRGVHNHSHAAVPGVLLQKQMTMKVEELFNYVLQTWIDGSIWKPKDWSVYGQSVRTNNDCEDGVSCERTVGRFGDCWQDTPPGTTAKIHCPAAPGFDTKKFAYKECTVNGTWYENSDVKWPIYSQCRAVGIEMIDKDEDRKTIYIFIGGFSLSLVLLFISLAIFFHFKQLRCDRITIHKNLFISYVLTGISWILYYALVHLDGVVISNNPLWCRMLHVLCQYFVVCNFMWMFCEGLYLNTIMIYAFTSGKTLIISCYIIGWFVPSILTTTYAVLRSKDGNESIDCWKDPDSSLQWIMFGPVIFTIVINAIFLINIVRLLITKLRQLPEATQTRKATRATLILVPLLGAQFILIPMKPPPGHPLEEFYLVIVALVISLQGTFVSVVYCFCNGEVMTLITRKYRQHRLMRTRSSIKSNSGHALTAYTTIDQVSQQNHPNSNTKESLQEIHLMETETA